MSEEVLEKKVLALKYRPHRFEDLVGQSTVSQTLSLALDSDRLSHAYLFSGLRGSGKTSTARIMAKALLCSTGPTSKPCEVCDNCISANSNRHLDIIEMDAASNRGIDDIKDLIEHTKYKPSSAKFKVFIIDEVHMLTTQAFNALLKTLEEPPAFVKFILATTDPLKLPATILSRTQHFRFNKIATTDVVHHLAHILNEENIEFENEALNILSRSGQGSLRDTLTLLDQAIIFSKGRVTTSSVVDMLGLIDPSVMDNIFSIILNKEDISSVIKDLENYEVSQICDEMTIYLKHKMLEKDARFDLLFYDRFFRILSDAKHLLAINSDGGFVLILTLMKMVEATNIKTIDEIISQVEKIEVKHDEVLHETKIEEPTPLDEQIASPDTIDISLNDETQIISNDTVIEEANIETQEEDDNKEYKELTAKVYDRDYKLGECFEANFIFDGFENNKLHIISYAQDEDRKFLYKHFGLIRTFAQDVYGNDVELEFKKGEETQKKNDENLAKDLDESDNNSNETGSMLEDIEMGSGCVADITKSSVQTPSQKELQINDILNSQMLNKAKELFDIKKITVKTRS